MGRSLGNKRVSNDLAEGGQSSAAVPIVIRDRSPYDALARGLVCGPYSVRDRHNPQARKSEHRHEEYRRGPLVFGLDAEMRAEAGAIFPILRLALRRCLRPPLRFGLGHSRPNGVR